MTPDEPVLSLPRSTPWERSIQRLVHIQVSYQFIFSKDSDHSLFMVEVDSPRDGFEKLHVKGFPHAFDL